MSDLCKGRLTQTGSDYLLNHQYYTCFECGARLTVTGYYLSKCGIPREHVRQRLAMKDFRFDAGMDSDQQYQVSYRLDLAETPTIDVLQRAFHNLYLQQRIEPGYLFVSIHDREALRRELWTSAYARMCISGPAGFDEESIMLGAACASRRQPVHLVALPGLEDGSVILGFFGERRW